MVAGPYQVAVKIKIEIGEKLKSLGLKKDPERIKITSLRKDRARFLGFDVFIRKVRSTYFKPTSRVKKAEKTINQRFTPRIIIHAPIKELLNKLIDYGYAKRNSNQEIYPRGKTSCIPMSHPQILNFYNSKIRGIINYYSCAHNRMNLYSIVRVLIYSCALTLAKKHKIKTLAQIFKKFGKELKYTNEIGKQYRIYRPQNLRILPLNERFNASNEKDVDILLKQTWNSSLTENKFEKGCVICGTFEKIEMHHIRSVKNVRMKINTYQQWSGAFSRKSIPLCKPHHIQLHSGKLTREEAKKIAEYKGPSSK